MLLASFLLHQKNGMKHEMEETCSFPALASKGGVLSRSRRVPDFNYLRLAIVNQKDFRVNWTSQKDNNDVVNSKKNYFLLSPFVMVCLLCFAFLVITCTVTYFPHIYIYIYICILKYIFDTNAMDTMIFFPNYTNFVAVVIFYLFRYTFEPFFNTRKI